MTVDGRQPGRMKEDFEELSYLMIAGAMRPPDAVQPPVGSTGVANHQRRQPRLVANGIVVKSGIVVFLDGNRYFDVPPLLEKGGLGALRAIFEALG